MHPSAPGKEIPGPAMGEMKSNGGPTEPTNTAGMVAWQASMTEFSVFFYSMLSSMPKKSGMKVVQSH